jgi:magnesium transporter
MRTNYEIKEGRLVELGTESGPIALFVAPTADDRTLLLEGLGIDEHTLDSVLDPEEISRVEYDSLIERTTIIWKRPDRRADTDAARFELSSVGIFFDPGRLAIITADEPAPFDFARLPDALSLGALVLRLMRGTIDEYLARLRAIKRAAGQIQAQLNRTLDNRALVRMFDLTEDLIYYVDAIEANQVVLNRLAAAGERLGLTPDDLDLLEDMRIDNAQASRQGHIYTTVLAGLLDARGNIVNNNMNVLIKNLTVVNVVFLPLGVIAGIGGMSEFTGMASDYGLSWQLAYPLFLLGMVLFGFGMWKLIGMWIDRLMGGQAKLPADRYLPSDRPSS